MESTGLFNDPIWDQDLRFSLLSDNTLDFDVFSPKWVPATDIDLPLAFDGNGLFNHGNGQTSQPPDQVDNTTTNVTSWSDQGSRRVEKSRAARSKISDGAKARFELQFQIDPYPSTAEIEQLAQDEGLRPQAVRNWFNNARSRSRVTGEIHIMPQKYKTSSHLPSIDERMSEAQIDSVSVHSGSSKKTASSLKRWLDAPIETEGASLNAIQTAVSTSLSTWSWDELMHGAANDPLISPPQSVISRESRGSKSSITSYRISPAASVISQGSRPRRRGRRIYRTSPYTSPAASIVEERAAQPQSLRPHSTSQTVDAQYACTFCGRHCKNRWEWKRHEQTVHMPTTVWVCCLTMPHSADNNYATCAAKPEAARTFTRRDHLMQHIRNVHNGTFSMSSQSRLEEWSKRAPLPSQKHLQCGFCQQRCTDWKDRVEHVAQHFGDGARFASDWKCIRLLDDKDSLDYTLSAAAHNAIDLQGQTAPHQGRDSHSTCNSMHTPDRMSRSSALPPVPAKPGPVQCRYCKQAFPNLALANVEHIDCQSWSCRYLHDFEFAFYSKLDGSWGKFCCYCDKVFDPGEASSQAGLNHIVNAHGRWDCSHEMYNTIGAFVAHLVQTHGYEDRVEVNKEYVLSAFHMRRAAMFEAKVGSVVKTVPPGLVEMPAAAVDASVAHRKSLKKVSQGLKSIVHRKRSNRR